MILNEFKQELHELLKKYNVTIGVNVDGDNHGVSTNFVVVENNDAEHILCPFSSYLDASDVDKEYQR